MKFTTPNCWLPAYQWLAGLCDTSTGALLVFAPAWTLRLMGLHQLPSPIEFVSFVGVFVLSVGLAYLYAARWPMNFHFAPRWQTVWFLTALSRSLVAMFLTWQIIAGKIEAAWLTVALTDGALAIVQWAGLHLGWLEFKD